MQSLDRHRAGRSLRSAEGSLSRISALLLAVLPTVLGGCASIVIHERPVLDRTMVQPGSAATASTSEAAALLEAGVALDKKHPDWAITYYRDAALKALPEIPAEGVSSQLEIEAARGAQGTYRRAIEYILETAHRQAKVGNVPWTEVLDRAGIGVQGRLSLYEAARWEEVLPTRRFEVQGFHHQAGQGGIGAPVVASLIRTGNWGEPVADHPGGLTEPCKKYFPKSMSRAASAVLRPGSGPDEPLAVLELHDPVLDPEMHWQNTPDVTKLPLAYDMTVPLARQFHITNLNLLGAMAVLYPSEYTARTGIYMIDPYEAGKIPVVFVHGLMSSPEAWDNAINELRGDPELRKRYQFWMFFYSTGNPILASGARFRNALKDLRTQLDPEGKDPAFDRMMLIGHSMGGLLSRLSISSSGQTLWNTASKVPPEQIEMEPELKELLVQSLVFEPVPSVSRVIFVCTPHRGSPIGDDIVGQLASRMIRVPKDILTIRETLAKANGQENVSEAFRGTRYATSVAQLGTGNPVLQAINQLPISEKVPYHSIIGYNGKEPLPMGGDGVVPYTSAHLEGALSELVITSDHSAQEKSEAIAEMRRILTLHFNEYALERKALAQGEKPANRAARPQTQTPVHYALTPYSGSRPTQIMARTEIFLNTRQTR